MQEKKASPILIKFLEHIDELLAGGKNFQEILHFIDLFFANITTLELKLQLESHLYVKFLKNFETEECFNDFIKLMEKHYTRSDLEPRASQRDNSVWFFVQNPVFLAHTNSMFRLLERKRRNDIKVKIASLTYSATFKEKCNSLDAEFYVTKGNTFEKKYHDLKEVSQGALAVCWNGPLCHLAYAVNIFPNLVYWSHRFLAAPDGIALLLSGNPSDKPSYNRHGKRWFYFPNGFTINNFNKFVTWSNRRSNFGTFCRESLIDNASHWENVAALLKKHVCLVYHYAGRSEIHHKWCARYGIDISKIRYLGWLPNPEVAIRDMAFLLDGPILGQGLMGMEAFAGKIPIIAPSENDGFVKNFMHHNKFSAEEELISEVNGLRFKDLTELQLIVSKLLEPTFNARVGDILSRKIFDSQNKQASFEYFHNLLLTHV